MVSIVNIHALAEIMRQSCNPKIVNILNRIRDGSHTDDMLEKLRGEWPSGLRHCS